MKRLINEKNKTKLISFAMVIIVYILIELLSLTIGISRSFSSLLVPTCAYIAVALSLNLVVGFSGELSLGHAGFMAIGAFSGVISSYYFGQYIDSEILVFIISIIISGIVAGFAGLIISVPVLKLSGDYLAIVTLAFGQIIKSLINNVFLGIDDSGFHFSFISNNLNMNGGKMLITGPMGATDTKTISTFTGGVILILFSLFIIYSLLNSKYGRSIKSARDNRIAAETIGINITKTKTLAFVISAIIAGMAGCLYGLNYSTLQPSKFDFNTSIMILVYVVFGGLGNINGTIIATTCLYVLPELLRGLQDYRMLIYAIVLIIVMQISNSNRIAKLGSNVRDRLLRKEHHND